MRRVSLLILIAAASCGGSSPGHVPGARASGPAPVAEPVPTTDPLLEQIRAAANQTGEVADAEPAAGGARRTQVVRSINELVGTWIGIDYEGGRTTIRIFPGGGYRVDYEPTSRAACRYQGQFTLVDAGDGSGRQGLRYAFDVNTCNSSFVGRDSTDLINAYTGDTLELDEDGSGHIMPMTRS